MELNRRLFLIAATAPLYAAAPLTVLSAEEAGIVEALCDRIIPADESPGAKQAGVLYYIDRQLAGPLKRFAPQYHAGLPKFRALLDLSPDRQTAFLEHLDPGLNAFFQLVIDHAMQGFYGDPSHGGNRDEASWKMLGVQQMMDGGHGH